MPWRIHTKSVYHIGTNNAEREGRYDGCGEEIPVSTEEDEASEIWVDQFGWNSPRDRRRQEYRNARRMAIYTL